MKTTEIIIQDDNKSKAKQIESYMKQGNSLSGLEAIDLFKYYRLASHVHRMRKKYGEGSIIDMNKKISDVRYSRYRFTTQFLMEQNL